MTIERYFFFLTRFRFFQNKLSDAMFDLSSKIVIYNSNFFSSRQNPSVTVLPTMSVDGTRESEIRGKIEKNKIVIIPIKNKSRPLMSDIKYDASVIFPKLVYDRYPVENAPVIDERRINLGVTWRSYINDESFLIKLQIFENLYWPYPVRGSIPVYRSRIYVDFFNLRAYTDISDRNIAYISLDGKTVGATLKFVTKEDSSPDGGDGNSQRSRRRN